MAFDPVERTRAFLKTITPTSRVALLHDDDPDGVCSGVLATKLLKRAAGMDFHHRQIAPHEPFTTGITISDALAYDTTFDERVFQTVLRAQKPEDVIQSPLKQYHDAIQNEINKWIIRFKEEADYLPEARLKILELHPPYHIRSTLNTILSFTHDTLNTILLYQQRDNVINFSTRNQTGLVPLNDVLREAIAGLSDSEGGGHPKAAGGHCDAKDWPIVKQRITDQLRAYAKKNAQ